MIIIVDEFHDGRSSIEDTLSACRFEHIFLFKSIEEAFLYLNLDRPEEHKEGIDVILLNVNSDYVNGIDACEMIHAHEVYRYVPIILLVDGAGINKLEELSEVGTTDFLLKPIKKKELVARVKLAVTAKNEIERRISYETQLQRIVDDYKTINENLINISFLDSVAEISNRRCFDEMFPLEWLKAKIKQTPITVLMIDIDFFKNFNDLFGHQKGDECIKSLAAVFKRQSRREVGIVARYGGEEFVLVLPSTRLVDGEKLASRIQAAINKLKIPHGGSQVDDYVTVSIGIASEIPFGEDPWSLIQKADQALYTAKKEGRNRVISFPRII